MSNLRIPKQWPVRLSAAAAALLLSGVASADEPTCALHRPLPIERVVRRLSIDLRGTVPDMADYDLVAGKDEVPATLIESYLGSDEFRLQMRRYHESLLWTNPSIIIGDTGFALTTVDFGGGTVVHFMSGRRGTYRGGDGTHPCQNKMQSTLGYDANGAPNTEDFGMEAGKPLKLEGWVEVHPYWEPDAAKTIKICAFDAQATTTYTIASGADAGTYTCDHLTAQSKSSTCGCGPDLSYCILTNPVQGVVLSSMREQLLRLVDESTTGGKPYSDIVTTKHAVMNGPLVHYFKYLAQQQTLSRTQNAWQPSDGALPDLAYTDQDTWLPVERGGAHAGLLTLPAYLLRFQTNRGRANRYRIAFEGQYFQPPSTKDKDCAEIGNDLTGRCVCRGCHTTLEPLAAHFGKFAEAGSMSLVDLDTTYDTKSLCSKGLMPLAPTSAAWCDRFYVPVPSVADPDIRPYKLKALEYADVSHPLVEPNFDAGPGGLAADGIASGLFHRVAIDHLFEFLMKRPPNLDVTSPDYEDDALAEIAENFKAHDDLRQAISDLVNLPAYRRAP